MLLNNGDRPQDERPQHRKHGPEELQCPNDKKARWHQEAHPLVDLVQVVLRLDQVLAGLLVANEMQNSDEANGCSVERDGPDAKDLGYMRVEDEVWLVEGCG